MIIGAQGYTIRDFAKDEQGIRESLQKLKAIGYRALQVSAFGEIRPERLKEIAEESSLSIIVTHTNPSYIRDNTDAVIKAHKELDCKYIGIGSMPAEYRGSEEGLYKFLADFDTAARKIHDAGMKLQYHNHSFEYERFGEKTIFDIMAEKTDEKLWGFILDIFWTQLGGRCPAQQIKMLDGRIDICHFKDVKIVDNKPHTAAVMDGNLCWKEIFEACRQTGIKYAMVEQDDSYERNPFDELALSFNNLKKQGLC